MRSKTNVAVAGLMLTMTWAIDADAAVVTASLESYDDFPNPAYNLEDINGTAATPDTQTNDWVIYGNTSGFTVGYTTKLETSSFSTLSATSNGGPATPYSQPTDGVFKLAHGVGFGTDPIARTSQDYGYGARNNSALPSLSFTHELLGANETLMIFLSGIDSDQLSYDISATVTGSGGAYSATDSALPSSVVTGSDNRDGDYGILFLSITDAQPGDVLTFTFSTDYSEEAAASVDPGTYVAPSSFGVGIGAASVTVTEAFVPEPGAMALTLAGAGMLLGKRRTR